MTDDAARDAAQEIVDVADEECDHDPVWSSLDMVCRQCMSPAIVTALSEAERHGQADAAEAIADYHANVGLGKRLAALRGALAEAKKILGQHLDSLDDDPPSDDPAMRAYTVLLRAALAAAPGTPDAVFSRQDPPDGKAWYCPAEGCEGAATLPENAWYHVQTTGHPAPVLGDFPARAAPGGEQARG